jgi:hypothetical protein
MAFSIRTDTLPLDDLERLRAGAEVLASTNLERHVALLFRPRELHVARASNTADS